MSDPALTREVHNGSRAPVFVPGFGPLEPREAATVPDGPEVHELLGNGTLWTQDPATPPDMPTTTEES